MATESPLPLDADELIAQIDPVAAEATLAGDVVSTPTLDSAELSEAYGAPVVLEG